MGEEGRLQEVQVLLSENKWERNVALHLQDCRNRRFKYLLTGILQARYIHIYIYIYIYIYIEREREREREGQYVYR